MAALPFNMKVHGAQLFLVVLFPSSAGSAEADWKISANCTLLPTSLWGCTVHSAQHYTCGELCTHGRAVSFLPGT